MEKIAQYLFYSNFFFHAKHAATLLRNKCDDVTCIIHASSLVHTTYFFHKNSTYLDKVNDCSLLLFIKLIFLEL